MSDDSEVDWNPRCQCTIWRHPNSTVDRLPVWHVYYFLTHPDPQVQAAALSRLIYLQRMAEDLDIHWVRQNLLETYQVLQNLGASEQLQVRQLAEQFLKPPTESDLSVLRLDEAALANARERVRSNRPQRFTKRETARQAIWDWEWQLPLPASAKSDVEELSGRHRRWLCQTSASRATARLEERHLTAFLTDADCYTRYEAGNYLLHRKGRLGTEPADPDAARSLVLNISADEPCPAAAQILTLLRLLVGTPTEQQDAMTEIVQMGAERRHHTLTWVLSNCDISPEARRPLLTATDPRLRTSALVRYPTQTLPRLPGYDTGTLAEVLDPEELYHQFLTQWRRVFKPAKKRQTPDKIWANWKSRARPADSWDTPAMERRLDALHAIADRARPPATRFNELKQQLNIHDNTAGYVLKSVGWCLLAEAHQSSWYPDIADAWMAVFRQFPAIADSSLGGRYALDRPGWPAALCESAPDALAPERWPDFWRRTDSLLVEKVTLRSEHSYGSHLEKVNDVVWDPLWRVELTELGNRAVRMLADHRGSMTPETRAQLQRVAMRAAGEPLALLAKNRTA